MKLREGDLIKDTNRIIFDVKGLIHPPSKVIAFPRFIPDSSGNRKNGETTYTKVYALSKRFEFLARNYPKYIIYDSVFDEKLCEVPTENIESHYIPIRHLRKLHDSSRLDELERCALDFLELLRTYANIPWNKMGISGSILVKLHTSASDVDPIVYGTKNCRRAYEALRTLQQDSKSMVRQYSDEELQRLYQFRSKDTQMSFGNFIQTESRKVLQGTFRNKDYFIRFVKDWKEIEEKYGQVYYKNAGYARIKAEIEDDSQAIFTPCSYQIGNVEALEGHNSNPIEEVSSFRGRFCEQARIGEVVIAQGKVEKVTDSQRNREFFRLLLGNKTSDFMILAD